MKKTNVFMLIVSMAFVAAACSGSNFLVAKQGKSYFMGSNSDTKHEMLCVSGDLGKILDSSTLSRELKDSLYTYSCSEERSGEKVMQIYASMTAEQRKDIKAAFKLNGYKINPAKGCCADQ